MCGPNRDPQKTPHQSQHDAIKYLKNGLKAGRDWPTCMLESMALWTSPKDLYKGRRVSYFIAGEAFDWLLLAERMCNAVGGLIPQEDKEELLFNGRLPACFDTSNIRDLLGVEKYRGYLNYYYGITVEEALLLATELEVQKRHESNGLRYIDDYTSEAFEKLYGKPMVELLDKFRKEKHYNAKRTITFAEAKEFTYWLFKYRLKNSDKAKIASDTWKGLQQLKLMGAHLGPEDHESYLLSKHLA